LKIYLKIIKKSWNFYSNSHETAERCNAESEEFTSALESALKQRAEREG